MVATDTAIPNDDEPAQGGNSGGNNGGNQQGGGSQDTGGGAGAVRASDQRHERSSTPNYQRDIRKGVSRFL